MHDEVLSIGLFYSYNVHFRVCTHKIKHIYLIQEAAIEEMEAVLREDLIDVPMDCVRGKK